MCFCVSAVSTRVYLGTIQGQKELNLLELELEVAVRHLIKVPDKGTEIESSLL